MIFDTSTTEGLRRWLDHMAQNGMTTEDGTAPN